MLWGDFENSDPEQVEQLYQELVQNMVANVLPLSQSPKQGPSSGSISSTTSTSSAGSSQPILPTASSSNNTGNDSIRKYFAVCANTGDQLVHLGEANVSSARRDSSFFHKIWSEYETLRGFRISGLRSMLIKPIDVKFVQVLKSFLQSHGNL